MANKIVEALDKILYLQGICYQETQETGPILTLREIHETFQQLFGKLDIAIFYSMGTYNIIKKIILYHSNMTY